jgi:hypothetical protein
VSLWFSTSLAKEQSWAVEWATAPKNIESNLDGTPLIVVTNTPTTAAGLKQCEQQMIHDSGFHQSFSVLGMCLILALGGLIIILGMSLDAIVGRLRPAKTRYMSEQWDLEETLALHRAAYVGFGHWDEHLSKDLPPSVIFARKSSLSRDEETKGVSTPTRPATRSKGEYVAVDTEMVDERRN